MMTAEATLTQPIFTTLDIPRSPDHLTPAWLTAALRSRGTIGQAEVTALRVESIGELEGVISQTVRVHLSYSYPKKFRTTSQKDEIGQDFSGGQYDWPTEKAPATLLAKFPHANPDLRQRWSEQGLYAREGRFYDTFAPTINLRTPTCYTSAVDVERHNYILLLEDLAPAKSGDQVAGCSLEQAKMAILGLADLHAPYWNRAGLDDLTSLTELPAHQAIYLERWPKFVEKYGRDLPDIVLEVGEEFGAAIPAIWQQLSQSPTTLLHGDYRLDNIMFGTAEGGPPFAVIDWQLLYKGPGTIDVAYFLGGSLTPDMRREHELALLSLYHTALEQHGVQGYSFDQCLLDYRRSMFREFSILVRALAGLDLKGRLGLMVAARLERIVAILTDLRLKELLPG